MDNPPLPTITEVEVNDPPMEVLPEVLSVPSISKVLEGAELAIPTLPVLVTTKGEEVVPLTWKTCIGEVIPIPTLPEATTSDPPTPVVPIPTLPLSSTAKPKLELALF